MNVYFSSTHLQTLCDLKALAEKHGCFIRFGVNQENSVDVDFDKFDKATEKIIHELLNKGMFSQSVYNVTSMYFELFDNNNKTYHTLTYNEGSQCTSYELDWADELSDEAISFLEYNLVEWQTIDDIDDTKLTIYCRLDGTKIAGFPNQKHPSVYREGMALKFFGDLVCDYLGEERIVRTY